LELLRGLLGPCDRPLSRFETAQHPEFVDRLAKAVGRRLTRSSRALNVLELFGEEAVTRALASAVNRPLKDLKVAPYYGCLLVRPPRVTQFDDPERPQSMDRLLEAIGASVVDFDFKTECCGASHGISRTDLVTAVAVACPLCHTNLDSRQDAAGARRGEDLTMPVYYVTQLVGLALGLDPAQLGLGRHLVNATALLREKKLA